MVDLVQLQVIRVLAMTEQRTTVLVIVSMLRTRQVNLVPILLQMEFLGTCIKDLQAIKEVAITEVSKAPK